MKRGSRWLLAALASAAVHAGGVGALWALRAGAPTITPPAIAPAAAPEPLQVALFTVTKPAAAAASPADKPAAPALEVRPARATRRSPPAPTAAAPAPSEPSVPAPSAAHPSPTIDSPEPPAPEATVDASDAEGAAAGGAPSGMEETGSGEGGGGGASTGGGTMTAGSGGTGSATAAEDLRPLTEALRRSAERCYPAAAARYRLTGTASISFCVEPGGSFSALRLERTSGHSLLDRAAVSCVVPGAVPLRVSPGCFTLPVAFEPGR